MNKLTDFILKNKKKLVIITLSVILFVGIFIYTYFNFIFNLRIKGDSIIKLDYNSNYTEPGFKAFFLGEDLSDSVVVESNVDNTKLGVYTIKYSFKKNGLKKVIERKVEVVDRTSPVIKLKGELKKNICSNKEYIEEGYEAIDDYDGDITDRVKIIKQDNLIIYQVSDNSNNKTEEIREIIKQDIVKPEISLTAPENYYLRVNSKYSEPGYKAFDNCEGDITSKVTITNNIDYTKSGKYTIEYKVIDSDGNEDIKIRNIIVVNYNETLPSNKIGEIYLTFDDGPSETITPKLLDILKEKNVKVTFFVINPKGLDHIIKRAHDEGHVIALHSFSHNYQSVYTSEENFFRELNLIRDKVEEITGIKSNLFRFPGGSSNTVSKKYNLGIVTRTTKTLLNQGYHIFDWNVSSGDAGGAQNKEQVYRNVINGLSKSRPNIVLMHDSNNNYKTLNAIADIIEYGKKNGYVFKTIDQTTPMIRHRIAN